MTKYQDLCARKQLQYPGMFSDENLNPGFIQAYNSGDRFRVLVDFGYDKPIWGYVGVTSGWQPMFLLMRRRGQRGSSDTIGPEAKIIATKFLKD